MISKKDYEAALEIVNQYQAEEKQRNQIILIHIMNDLKQLFKAPEYERYRQFTLDHAITGSVVQIRFSGDWSEDFDGSEPILKELERIGNDYNKTLKIPYYYYQK